MISPPPGVSISATIGRKYEATPSALILSSISRLADSLSVFCTSRMHTPRAPGRIRHRSIAASAKWCDFPEPRPPYAALYRAGSSSGANAPGLRSVSVAGINDAALDPLHDRPAVLSAKLMLVDDVPGGLEQQPQPGELVVKFDHEPTLGIPRPASDRAAHGFRQRGDRLGAIDTARGDIAHVVERDMLQLHQ